MSNEPIESAALTNEQIAPDTGAQPLGDASEASDPDIRNTTADQEDVETPQGNENDAD